MQLNSAIDRLKRFAKMKRRICIIKRFDFSNKGQNILFLYKIFLGNIKGQLQFNINFNKFLIFEFGIQEYQMNKLNQIKIIFSLLISI